MILNFYMIILKYYIFFCRWKIYKVIFIIVDRIKLIISFNVDKNLGMIYMV